MAVSPFDDRDGFIWFDGKLVRKDGIFTLPALKKLNPEHLLGKRS